MRGSREPRFKPRKLGVIRKSQRYIPEDMSDFSTITNITLHPKSGQPIIKTLDVQERKKVRKGMHTHWLVLLMGDRGEIIKREVLA